MTKLERLLNQDGLFIAAHRGFSAIYPENTLLAVKEAVARGVDLIEVDVYLSRDGVPVIAHDQHLDRCSTGTGLVHEHTLKELKELDFGIHRGVEYEGIKLPTLEQFLTFMKDYSEVLMDIDFKVYDKTIDTVKAAMPLIERMGLMDRAVFNCIDCKVVSYITERYGRRVIGAPADYRWRVNYTDDFLKTVWGVCIPYDMLNAERVQFYRDLGIAVVLTPCDNDEQVKYAMQFSPTLPLCDDPRAYMRLAQEKKIWTPWKACLE